MPDKPLSISEVAQAFGIRPSALRYYEEIGLAKPSQRRGRVRYYDTEALRQLALMLIWHIDGGTPLSDTLKLMNSNEHAARHELIQHNIDRIDSQTNQLKHARAVLAHMLECPKDDFIHCPDTQRMIDQSLAAKFSQHRTDGEKCS
ncbi:MerR family transcriptional regulator [Mycobacteroides abscessus]